MLQEVKAKIKRIAAKVFVKFLDNGFAVVVLFCRNREERFEKICYDRNIAPATARKVIIMWLKIGFIIVVGLGSLGEDVREWANRMIDVLS